jgi:Ca-activated chloride channel family protein
MFSEHDLGLDGPTCERTLCLRTAIGISSDLHGRPSGWLQIGLSSNINMETYQRPALTIVAAVDNSGSMGWSYETAFNEYQIPLTIARELLSRIAGELGPQDRLAIVTYGSTVSTPLIFVPGDRQSQIQSAINGMRADGSTDMESGLKRAYELLAEAGGDNPKRVLLLTDAQPNVGASTPTEFDRLVSEGAANGAGITVFGIGPGLGQEMVNAMAHVRGGNAFTLYESQDVEHLMSNDWPWLVSPIAYGLTLQLSPSQNHGIAETYGFPRGPSADSLTMSVPTVFLSKRKGALLVRLTPDSLSQSLTNLSVTGGMTYDTPSGQQVEQSFQAGYADRPLDVQGRYFEQFSVARSVALAMLVTAMHDAADAYADDSGEAVAILSDALDLLRSASESLNDPAFQQELALADRMLDLMISGAAQGDLYPTVY